MFFSGRRRNSSKGTEVEGKYIPWGVIGEVSGHQPVLKTSTGTHPFFNQQQTAEGRNVAPFYIYGTPDWQCPTISKIATGWYELVVTQWTSITSTNQANGLLNKNQKSKAVVVLRSPENSDISPVKSHIFHTILLYHINPQCFYN